MPESTLIERRKMYSRNSAEISIELAPYLMAYKNYKKIIDHQGGSTNSVMERAYKATFEDLRLRLQDCLSPLTGGDFEELFDQAMGLNRLKLVQRVSAMVDKPIASIQSLKHSAAYESLSDSFVEILSNAVDEAIAKHFASPESVQPIESLKATLCINVDDSSSPERLSISCFNKNGRGFQTTFLDKVSSPEKREEYMATASSSSKLSDAKQMADIPLFIGGRGQGLRMLMRKIDEGTYSAAPRRDVQHLNKSASSEIEFSNKIDEAGNIQGALITITTSKVARSSAIYERKPAATDISRSFKEKSQGAKRSPLSIAIDLDNADDNSSFEDSPQGSASPFTRR